MSARDKQQFCEQRDGLCLPPQTGNERKTLLVIVITAVTMVVEIGAGWTFGSMALLADGWHMAGHVAALSITLFAYRFARRHERNPAFSFGTGKVASLGGFASAVALLLVALLMAAESVHRLFSPVAIDFGWAILVAVVGLVVNLGCALILGHTHGDEEGHSHDHDHDHGQDHNIRAAYLHVLADALTSFAAIFALLGGKYLGWNVLDPVMGVAGSILIAKWSLGLIRESGSVLLDHYPGDRGVQAVRRAVEEPGDATVTDLHYWRVGQGRVSVLVSLAADDPKSPEDYKKRLESFPEIAHLVVEVNPQ